MRNVCFQIVGTWGTKSGLNIAEYLWIVSMFGVLVGLENNQIGLYSNSTFRSNADHSY
jgi:hypothetical protein